MAAPHPTCSDPEDGPRRFVTTHWSQVLAAGRDSSPQSRAALETLCKTYWGPLYSYVRRTGHSEADARDLVQGFFVDFLAEEALGQADRERGKFRSFLLLRLKTFLSNQQARANAQKRGGGIVHLSIDEVTEEEKYRLEPADTLTPEMIFERRWAQRVIETAQESLAAEYRKAGKEAQFAVMREYLDGDSSKTPYAEAAGPLNMSEDAFKKAVQRMRQRCLALIRLTIEQTVGTPGEVKDEMRHLIQILSTPVGGH
jgi:RNA polymerase sigma factor (sigma-70 family)